MKLKVCGLNNSENITAIESLPGVDYTGFIFVEKSPRNAFSLSAVPPKNASVTRVGVFMNASLAAIRAKMEEFDLDVIQLHGSESPDFCREVSAFASVFKAFGIEGEEDLEALKDYDKCCDAFVLDKKTPNGGGSGEQYDWQLLAEYAHKTPYLLSGGIGLADAKELSRLQLPNCMGYDVNSRFEECPGLKKVNEIELFITQINS